MHVFQNPAGIEIKGKFLLFEFLQSVRARWIVTDDSAGGLIDMYFIDEVETFVITNEQKFYEFCEIMKEFVTVDLKEVDRKQNK